MIYSGSKYSHTVRTFFFFQSRKVQAQCVLMCLQKKRAEEDETKRRRRRNRMMIMVRSKKNEISYTQNI